jgi:hypothetical protein
MSKAVPMSGGVMASRPASVSFPDLESPLERMTVLTSRIGGLSAFVVAICALAYQFA